MAISFDMRSLLPMFAAMMAAYPACADYLIIGGAAYTGRVIEAENHRVVFDFGCRGQVRTIALQEGIELGISGDCGDFEAQSIGGRSMCPEKRIFDQLFRIYFHGKDRSDADFFAFDYYKYDGKVLKWGISGDVSVANYSQFMIETLPRDFCLNEGFD